MLYIIFSGYVLVFTGEYFLPTVDYRVMWQYSSTSFTGIYFFEWTLKNSRRVLFFNDIHYSSQEEEEEGQKVEFDPFYYMSKK